VNLTTAIETINAIAERAGCKDINQAFALIKELEAFHAQEHLERSATSDDKAKVAALYDSLDGELVSLKDLPPRDIVARAGARNNQGVRMHASRDLAKRLLVKTGGVSGTLKADPGVMHTEEPTASKKSK
jgi:hypothetical protein